MVDVDVQVNQWLDIKELMGKMYDMNMKRDEITRQAIDFQNIVQSPDLSSEEDGCSKPKIDIHLRWKKRSKEHEIRLVVN